MAGGKGGAPPRRATARKRSTHVAAAAVADEASSIVSSTSAAASSTRAAAGVAAPCAAGVRSLYLVHIKTLGEGTYGKVIGTWMHTAPDDASDGHHTRSNHVATSAASSPAPTRHVCSCGGTLEPVAIKTYKPQPRHKMSRRDGTAVPSPASVGDPAQLTLREVVALGALPPHPNVVSAHTMYINDTRHVMVVMPRARMNAFHLLERLPERRLPANWVLKWSAQLIAAVRHLHASRWLHRDIKLENLLITPSGDLVLSDLGLARHLPAAVCCDRHAPSVTAQLERFVTSRQPRFTTETVTLWTRPPEICSHELNGTVAGQYGGEVDAWSAGITMLSFAVGDHVLRGYPTTAAVYRRIQAKLCVMDGSNATPEGAPSSAPGSSSAGGGGSASAASGGSGGSGGTSGQHGVPQPPASRAPLDASTIVRRLRRLAPGRDDIPDSFFLMVGSLLRWDWRTRPALATIDSWAPDFLAAAAAADAAIAASGVVLPPPFHLPVTSSDWRPPPPPHADSVAADTAGAAVSSTTVRLHTRGSTIRGAAAATTAAATAAAPAAAPTAAARWVALDAVSLIFDARHRVRGPRTAAPPHLPMTRFLIAAATAVRTAYPVLELQPAVVGNAIDLAHIFLRVQNVEIASGMLPAALALAPELIAVLALDMTAKLYLTVWEPQHTNILVKASRLVVSTHRSPSVAEIHERESLMLSALQCNAVVSAAENWYVGGVHMRCCCLVCVCGGVLCTTVYDVTMQVGAFVSTHAGVGRGKSCSWACGWCAPCCHSIHVHHTAACGTHVSA